MSYSVVFANPVRKQLEKLGEPALGRVMQRIERLAEEPRPPGCLKLTGFTNEYRLRVGDYRVRYVVDDAKREVGILSVLPRGDAYR